MLELEEARERLLAPIPPLPAESIPVSAGAGRIVAETIQAPMDLPCSDNSAMDGYAVRADDLKNASAEAPARLKVCGENPAGEVFSGSVEPGTCVRVFTGSFLPTGADAVVMQEDTRLVQRAVKEALVSESIKPFENVRFRGEDVRRGALLFSNGADLNAAGMALLAALGIKQVRVHRRPVIGLLATGSELIEAGEPLEPGKIYESNRVMLATLLERAGAIPRVYPLVPDSLAASQTMLEKALGECDGVVTTGGVSAGDHDFVKKAFEQIGGVMDFWKVAIRPGKPFVFGRCQGKFLFGLPGNPVSALVTFLLLVRPALLRWQGAASVEWPAAHGTLAEPLANRGERRHFMRVTADAFGKVRSAGAQGSHMLSSLAKANGLVDVPPHSTLGIGTGVQVLRWGG